MTWQFYSTVVIPIPILSLIFFSYRKIHDGSQLCMHVYVHNSTSGCTLFDYGWYNDYCASVTYGADVMHTDISTMKVPSNSKYRV